MSHKNLNAVVVPSLIVEQSVLGDPSFAWVTMGEKAWWPTVRKPGDLAGTSVNIEQSIKNPKETAKAWAKSLGYTHYAVVKFTGLYLQVQVW